MSAEFGEIEGLSGLLEQLAKLKDLDLEKILLAGGYRLMEGSMRRSPVDTGYMRDSHEVVSTGEGVEMRVNTEYAVHQEFGTSKMQAQPFVRPTIDEDADDIVQACKDEAEKQIQEKGG